MSDKFKVCLLGATAVGKTSLVARFVSSIFQERYVTTIGVTIQARRIVRADRTVDLVLWDLSGDDEFQSVQPSYLRGASGYLLVVDGTRRETIRTALMLQKLAQVETRRAPFVVVPNKSDLVGSWDVGVNEEMGELIRKGWCVVRASAKTGAGVEEAFDRLTSLMLDSQVKQWT